MAGQTWGRTSGSLITMRTNSFLLLLIFLFLIIESPAQEVKYCSILFYNTENLFDWKNDPVVNDDEFTPEGERHWTYQRFQQKILNLSKAILAASAWDQAAVIGLCEIENRFVLEQLISKTPLKTYPFQIIHKESPDPRGIDVALLYNSELFEPFQYDYLPMLNDDGSIRQTREILYVKGKLKSSADTIHLFVNHWPSRYSGLLETEEWRNEAASILKQKTDSLFQINTELNIIILGDFNDQSQDESIYEILQAGTLLGESQPGKLYNLSSGWGDEGKGSIKYQSQWFVFDQVIVSSPLIDQNRSTGIIIPEAKIVQDVFLLETDERYGGQRPKRTYYGYEYQGGFSDHLPVKLKIEIR